MRAATTTCCKGSATQRESTNAKTSENRKAIKPPSIIGSRKSSANIFNTGTFGLFGSLPSYAIVGLPVPSLTSGTLGWTHTGVSLAGTLTGGVLTKVLPTATVSGAIAFSTSGAKTLSGTASIAPITSALFRLLPISGVNFTASLNNNGLTLPGGALFEFSNFLTSGLAVPAVTLATDGSFSVNVGVPSPLSFTLRNFNLDNVTFSLLRDAAGNLTVPTFGGSLTVPQLNVPVTVNGSWANNGTYNLIGSIGGAVNLSTLGLPVSGLNGGAAVSFNQTSLTVSGNLNGPIFSTLPGAAVGGALTVTPSSVTLGGTVTVPPLTLGAFSIQPVGGGPISALWTNSGVVFPANLRLFYNGASAGTFNLPAFTNAPNGDFTLIIPSSAPVTFSIGTGAAAWSLNNAYFTLRRVGGVVSIPTFNAQVTVPGFTTSPVISVGGSLSSDGSFSLANTFALSGPLNAVGSSFGALALASLNFDNTSLRVGGTLSGGALGSINSGVTVSGSIRVTTSGQLFPSGSVTFPDLQLPDVSSGFRLLPLSGGNFVATLNETGVILPGGARVYWRGTQLGNFTLPTFTIPANGNFFIPFGPVSFGLEGYALSNVSATLGRTGGVTTLVIAGSSTLNVPGFANLDVGVSGTLTNNGTFLLSGSVSSAAFPGGFPVSTLNSANASFARNSGGTVSLRLTGDVSGGAITGSSADDLRLVSASATVDVSSAGTLAFIGSLQVRSFSVLNFFIEGNWPTNNGVITATLDNNNLTLSGARLRSTVAGLFAVNIPLPAISVPFNGEFAIPVSPPNMTIWGYSITGINFNLRRVAPNLFGLRMFYMDNFAGNLAGSLAATGFGQRFTGGSILADGGTDLAWYGALTVDGFTTSSASGYVHMFDNTVYAGGSFNLFAMNRAFNGQFQFDGSVDKNANYTLTGSGSLDIANIEMPSASFSFHNGKITGSPTLKFGDGSGKLDFTPGNFQLAQASGVSFSHSIGFNQSITIANSVSIASLNVNANLSASGGNSGQVRVTGSASAFGFNLPNLDFGVGSDLEFVLNFGPNCVNFDLAPVRAKFCGAAWP